MAKINDFQLKGVKMFQGRDGYGVNANLYYKGKKVAFVLDEGCGGMLDIDYVYVDHSKREEISKEIEKEAREYYKRNPKHLLNPKMQILDLVEDLLKLDYLEKVYKKELKKGYNATFELKYYNDKASLEEICKSKRDIIISCNTKDSVKTAEFLKKEHSESNDPVRVVNIYDSLESFSVKR